MPRKPKKPPLDPTNPVDRSELVRQYQARGQRRGKYNARRCTHDGRTFDSLRERDAYISLCQRVANGELRDLECQVPFALKVNGQLICKYIADFQAAEVATGQVLILDAKGMKTPIYRLKKKLMLAIHGIAIMEL